MVWIETYSGRSEKRPTRELVSQLIALGRLGKGSGFFSGGNNSSLNLPFSPALAAILQSNV